MKTHNNYYILHFNILIHSGDKGHLLSMNFLYLLQGVHVLFSFQCFPLVSNSSITFFAYTNFTLTHVIIPSV